MNDHEKLTKAIHGVSEMLFLLAFIMLFGMCGVCEKLDKVNTSIERIEYKGQ